MVCERGVESERPGFISDLFIFFLNRQHFFFFFFFLRVGNLFDVGGERDNKLRGSAGK